MAVTPKVMGQGQLAATKGTLYTAPAGGAVVRFFRCFNAGGATETVKLYVNPGGTSRQIAQASLAAAETLVALEAGEVLTLENGDLIEGETTSATTVDYVITGVELS